VSHKAKDPPPPSQNSTNAERRKQPARNATKVLDYTEIDGVSHKPRAAPAVEGSIDDGQLDEDPKLDQLPFLYVRKRSWFHSAPLLTPLAHLATRTRSSRRSSASTARWTTSTTCAITGSTRQRKAPFARIRSSRRPPSRPSTAASCARGPTPRTMSPPTSSTTTRPGTCCASSATAATASAASCGSQAAESSGARRSR
jgi:hypothetical protein